MVASDLHFRPDYPGFADGRALPPRSRLFALEPIGIGTPAVEGLISYIIRLAEAYSVSPRRLIRSEIMKIVPGIEKYRQHGLFFERDARSINGLHQHSSSFSDAIETLCGLKEARLLTLLNLNELLPFNGTGLIATYPRWCPACIRERLDSYLKIYLPLAWSFDLYHICSRHKKALLDRCPSCGEFQHVFPQVPVLGFCCHCGACLAYGAAEKQSVDQMDQWVASAIEEIVVELPRLSELATRNHFVSQLGRAISKYSGGSKRRFCLDVGLHPNVSSFWFREKMRPTLPQWLSIAYGLNIGPVEFLRMNITPEVGALGLRALDRDIKPRIFRPSLTKAQLAAIEAELQREAESGDGSISVTQIAERHQLTRIYLRWYWPELCRTISRAYRTRVRSLAKKKKHREHAIVQKSLDDLVEHGIYPSQNALNFALNGTGITTLTPEVEQIRKQCLMNMLSPNPGHISES